jgi:hypothetical protein
LERAHVKKELETLLNRIEGYGAPWMVDEHGSHGEDTAMLFSALTPEEEQKVYSAEKSRKAKMTSAA